MELTNLQFQILDCLYFVEPFHKIVEETGAPTKVVADELKTMISRRWVQVMRFDSELNDFVATLFYDSDNLQECSFLATKEGLLLHNGYGT
ncbi:MAG: hypothetical protein NZ108_07560 [Bacteroidia bacterium]|nr:hypothetical protein [Bacteroidia bacterium]